MTATLLIGARWGEFLVLTALVFGGAAALTGQALARNWRPAAQLFLYAPLLAASDRFLLYAIFGDPLLSASGFLVAALLLLCIALIAYRLILVRRMVSQYPWLYRRAGPFAWRERAGARPET